MVRLERGLVILEVITGIAPLIGLIGTVSGLIHVFASLGLSAGAADAKRIDIHWEWHDGDPIASILDDGSGMPEPRLVEAMRFGGVGPDAPRGDRDLGRFGLGLKTASLSQCRQLTVVSKTAGSLSSFTWDVDRIRDAGDGWHLIVGADGLSTRPLQDLKKKKCGTLVAWRKIDFPRRLRGMAED